MTQEEKKILLKDLCARLPYGIKVRLQGKPRIVFGVQETLIIVRAKSEKGGWEWDEYDIEEWNTKPYLRPMSSMTEEEYAELKKMTITSPNLETAVTLFWEHYYDEAPNWRNDWTRCALPKVLDWLNAHHFDYRGLIEKGLALEAKEGMYEKESV